MSNTWPFDPNLKAFGATYTPARVAPGQAYWRLVEARGPYEYGGRHHIYVDVLGEAGQRLTGILLRYFWNDGYSLERTEAKPGEPAASNLPMYAKGNSYGVRVDDSLPSDEIFGMGLLDRQPHVSFRLVFKRTVAQGEPETPEPPTPPVGDVTLREAIEQAQHWLDVARGLL